MKELTMKEYAEIERVTYRTVQRWVEKGAVDIRRTPTGRVRIQNHQRAVIFSTTNDDKSGQFNR